MDRIELARVEYVPRELEPGILYVAEKFGAAVHLCPCGCGTKVSTPLGPVEWTLEETAVGPTMTPSVGNWQFDCRSHYFIRDGRIVWAGAWDNTQVEAGRRAEQQRRHAHFAARARQRRSLVQRVWGWLTGLFK